MVQRDKEIKRLSRDREQDVDPAADAAEADLAFARERSPISVVLTVTR